MRITMPVTVRADLNLSTSQLADLLMDYLLETYVEQGFDDAGCDWNTTPDTRHVVVGNERDWIASTNPEAAVLMDAINTLRGFSLHIDEREAVLQ